MANHELSPSASQPDFHEEARRNTLDAAGFSIDEIDRFMGVLDPDYVPYPKPRVPSHRVSHRGGRGFPQEESRADMPELPNPTPLTTEERKARMGVEHAKVALDASVAMDHGLQKAAGGDVRTHLALQRARTEKRNAERRRLGLDV